MLSAAASLLVGKMADTPREAAAIAGVLRAQGAPAWEPRVVAQLLEFSYRHVADVLDGAQQYAAHRSRDAQITQADVRLAAQSALTHTFTEPLAGEELARIVTPLNAAPLPPVVSRPGVAVPAEGALLAPNFQARHARGARLLSLPADVALRRRCCRRRRTRPLQKRLRCRIRQPRTPLPPHRRSMRLALRCLQRVSANASTRWLKGGWTKTRDNKERLPPRVVES